MPTVDDFCKALENQGKTEVFDQIKQSINASRLLNPLLNVSLPKEMNEKLAVFRTPTISKCIVYDSIEDISNFSKIIILVLRKWVTKMPRPNQDGCCSLWKYNRTKSNKIMP